MPPFGPIYCETPELVGDLFPVELINTLTNAPTVLLGVIALFLLRRVGSKNPALYTLALLLSITGVGSSLWHGTRLPWALTGDVFPGIIFLLLFLYLVGRLLWGRTLGGVAVLFLLGFQFIAFRFLPLPSIFGFYSPLILLFGSVLFIGTVFLLSSWYKMGRVTWLLAGVILFALFAAIMRTIDGAVCEMIPIGTHLLWHISLGVAGFLGIYYLHRGETETPSSPA